MAKARAERRDRRQELLEVASRLFVEQGYHASTMDDIAGALNLNKGTLYYYYDSKANILFDIMLKINQRYLETVRARRPGSTSIEAVREYIEATVVFILNNVNDTKLNQQEWPFIDRSLTRDQSRLLRDLFREIDACLIHLIEEAIVAKEFRPIDARIVSEAVTGIVGWLPRWFRARGKRTIEEVASTCCDLIIHGLVEYEGEPQKSHPVPSRELTT